MPDEKLIHVRIYDSERFDAAEKRRLIHILATAAEMTETEFINMLLDDTFAQLSESDVTAFLAADTAASKFMEKRKPAEIRIATESKKARRKG